jgi:hypothetical protein
MYSEVHIQGKKNIGKYIPNFKTRNKKGNSRGEKRCGVGVGEKRRESFNWHTLSPIRFG